MSKRKVDRAKTYRVDEPHVHEAAGRIIAHLLDHGQVRGGVVEGTWRSAAWCFAAALHPAEQVCTRTSIGTASGYLAYFHTVAALALLEEAGFVRVDREDSGESWQVALVE